jgi:hypothetical protein
MAREVTYNDCLCQKDKTPAKRLTGLLPRLLLATSIRFRGTLKRLGRSGQEVFRRWMRGAWRCCERRLKLAWTWARDCRDRKDHRGRPRRGNASKRKSLYSLSPTYILICAILTPGGIDGIGPNSCPGACMVAKEPPHLQGIFAKLNAPFNVENVCTRIGSVDPAKKKSESPLSLSSGGAIQNRMFHLATWNGHAISLANSFVSLAPPTITTSISCSRMTSAWSCRTDIWDSVRPRGAIRSCSFRLSSRNSSVDLVNTAISRAFSESSFLAMDSSFRLAVSAKTPKSVSPATPSVTSNLNFPACGVEVSTSNRCGSLPGTIEAQRDCRDSDSCSPTRPTATKAANSVAITSQQNSCRSNFPFRPSDNFTSIEVLPKTRSWFNSAATWVAIFVQVAATVAAVIGIFRIWRSRRQSL